jgi:hypothetical protein
MSIVYPSMVLRSLRYLDISRLVDIAIARGLVVAEVGRVVRKQWIGWDMEGGYKGRFAEGFGSDVVRHLDLTDHLFVPSKLTSLRFVTSVFKQRQWLDAS